MSDFLRIITHARRFKSAVKELSVEQLGEIQNKLKKIIDDRIAEEEAAKIQNAERLAKIKQYKDMLAADGIDLDELQDMGFDRPGKRARRKPKYEIWNEAGEHITWTGQGRMPNVFKARVEAGEPLDTFLID
ncbi:MAG: H-NS family nucleoid-associated regulatory protein [Desulforhopalus sp.]